MLTPIDLSDMTAVQKVETGSLQVAKLRRVLRKGGFTQAIVENPYIKLDTIIIYGFIGSKRVEIVGEMQFQMGDV